MLANVLPHLLRTPVGDGIDLHQTKFVVPFDFACAGAGRGLVAPDARDPRLQLAQLALQRLDLPQIAA